VNVITDYSGPGLTASSRLQSAVGRADRAARDFEATLIASLLESSEKSFSSLHGEDGSPGSDDYKYLGIKTLSESMADAGGFGVAAIIRQHLPTGRTA
jgi:Rod binding domain-containing protein